MRKTPETPTCIVRLKRSNGVWSKDDDWKVTAHYVVKLSATKRLPCVRVSNYDAPGPYSVLHLSMREFHRLFRPRTEREFQTLMRAIQREADRNA